MTQNLTSQEMFQQERDDKKEEEPQQRGPSDFLQDEKSAVKQKNQHMMGLSQPILHNVDKRSSGEKEGTENFEDKIPIGSMNLEERLITQRDDKQDYPRSSLSRLSGQTKNQRDKTG